MAESWLDPAEILGLKETVDTTELEVPEGLFADESLDEMSTTIGMREDIVPEEDDDESEFAKGLRRQWNNVQSLTGEALEVYGNLIGNENLSDYGRGVSIKNQLEAQAVGAAEVERIEDVTTETLGSYVASSIGEALPTLVPLAAGATAARTLSNFFPYLRALKYGKTTVTALGALFPAVSLSVGEASQTQKDLMQRLTGSPVGEVPDDWAALFTGVKAGSLDAVTMIPILQAFKRAGGVVKSIKEIEDVFGVTTGIATKAAKAVPGIIMTGGKVGVIEGVTEALQEKVFISDAEKVTGFKMSKAEEQSRLLNSFVKGGIGGTAIGGGAQVISNILPAYIPTDSGLKLNDIEAGTVIKYPNFTTFKTEVTETDKQKIIKNYGAVFPDGINNEQDFLKLQEAEINNIVDKPARKSLQKVYDKGGRPFVANYYKKGPEQIRYNVAEKDGTLSERVELIDTSPLTRYKKNLGLGVDALINATVGKSVSALDDLASRSKAAESLRADFAYFDDGRGKKKVQEADIGEAILMNMGKFSTKSEQAMQSVSKIFRLPFASKIKAKTNRQLYQILTNPKFNLDPKNKNKIPANVIKGGKLFREGFEEMYQYVIDAEHTRGGIAFEGKTVGFTPGKVNNYFPIMIKYKKLQSSSKFRTEFEDMLAKNGFKDPAATVNDVIENKGFMNLTDTEGQMDPTKKAGNIERERKLKNLDPEQLGPFINTNVVDVYDRYRDSVVRRVEYGKRFGKENEILKLRINEIEAEAQAKGRPMTEKEKQRMFDIAKALQKQYKPIENNFFRKLNAALITYGYILTLPFATISSLSEPFLVLGRGGAGPTVILKSLFSGMKGIIRSTFPRFPRDEFDIAVADIGLGLEASVLERQAAAFGGGQETNKVTEKFFRLNWLSQFTRWNRMLANASGRNMVFSHARFLSSNMKRLDLTSVEELPQTGRYKVYAEQLRELGVNPNDAVAFVRSEAYRKNNVEEYKATPFYQDQVRLAGVRYVNEVVMNPRAVTRPMWMSDPKLALFSQLKGFQVAFSNTVLKRWIKETFKTGFYEGVPNGARYFAVGSIMVIAAAFGNELREFLQYGPKGSKRFKDESLWDKTKRALERTGFYGPLQFLLDAARAERFGSGPVESLMGPVVTRLVSYLEGIADLMTQGEKEKILREIIKSIPIVASNPAIRDRFYEALGVESTFGKKKSLTAIGG